MYLRDALVAAHEAKSPWRCSTNGGTSQQNSSSQQSRDGFTRHDINSYTTGLYKGCGHCIRERERECP